MEKLTRGLDSKHVYNFKKSKWFEFYKEHKDEDKLFLGIRNNYVNIYYNCMSIAKIQGTFTNAQIADEYSGKKYKGKTKQHSISFDDFIKDYDKIKRRVEKHINNPKSNLREKVTQANMTFNNNINIESDWVCIDIEYTKQRSNINDGDNSGRFDIIAVNKYNLRIALIELKVDKGALGEGNGLRKHAQDWNDFIENGLFSKSNKRLNREDYLVREINDIINNKYLLDENFPIKGCSEEKLKKIKPEFYFIICSGELSIKEIKNETRKYLWSKEKCQKYGIKRVGTRNIEKELGFDITENKKDRLYCNFLFAKNYGEDIKDIIDDKNYDIGIK